MSYNDYFGIYDNDYNMFTESSITGRYDYMDITEATQKFQIDVIDMLHEFTENVWITEATNVANGRRPYALFEAEGFWEKVKDMFRKAIAWIKDMYIKVKGWLLDKWEDTKKWWKTMGMSESDVKIAVDVYNSQIFNRECKVVPNDSVVDSTDLQKNGWDGSKNDKKGGLDVKIKYASFKALDEIEGLVSRIPTRTNDVSQFLIRFIKNNSTNSISDDTKKMATYNVDNKLLRIDSTTKKLSSKSLDEYFKTKIYAGEDSEKNHIISPSMLEEAVTVVFRLRNNFISRIMNHERACTKTLENTLRQAQKYQSGSTEYKNANDDILADYDTEENITSIEDGDNDTTTVAIKSKKNKMSVDVLSAQIRFNSELVKKSIEAYRRLLSNSISVLKRVMGNERIKKVVKAIKNGERESSAYKPLTESYGGYWDNNNYSNRNMESYMWS